MNVRLRQETVADYPAVAEMIISAYEDVSYSSHREQFMVERLRKSAAFIPELSIVAEAGHEIVGHILLTKIVIRGPQRGVDSLCLAPLSIAPLFQGKGIGGRLIAEAHRIAKELGYQSITLLGPAEYYSRFGYEPMKRHGIRPPFAIREENCMIISLTQNGLAGVSGEIEYPPEFME